MGETILNAKDYIRLGWRRLLGLLSSL